MLPQQGILWTCSFWTASGTEEYLMLRVLRLLSWVQGLYKMSQVLICVWMKAAYRVRGLH